MDTCSASCAWQAGSVVPGVCGAVCNPGDTGCGGYLSNGMPASKLPCGAGWYFEWTAPNVVYQGVCDATGQWTQNYCTGQCYDLTLGVNAYYCNCTPNTGVCINGGNCP